MHIALFSPAWPVGRHPNGIVTYANALTTELRAQGHRVSIVSPEVGPAVRDPDVHSRSPIDVIEMEESFGFAGRVARGIDVPLVVKLHGPAFLTMTAQELHTPFGRHKVLIEHRSLASLPALMAPSRCTLAETLSHYGLHPPIAAHVVNPVALGAQAPVWERSACQPDTLLFVGRFDAVKGGDLVISAFRKLRVARPRLRLTFVGPDNGLHAADGTTIHLRQYIASFADAGLEESISIRGVLSPEEIAALRVEAAVTVIASRRESQGYAALEAMLQGCPIVATDTSGLGEIVEHGVTGLKARPDDAADLAAQIARLLDEPGLGEVLGQAARDYVIEHHSPAAVVQQTLDVYRRAIDLHGGCHGR
jgi:glycosyltransferase involved in cell wall biosynthesis